MLKALYPELFGKLLICNAKYPQRLKLYDDLSNVVTEICQLSLVFCNDFLTADKYVSP